MVNGKAAKCHQHCLNLDHHNLSFNSPNSDMSKPVRAISEAYKPMFLRIEVQECAYKEYFVTLTLDL